MANEQPAGTAEFTPVLLWMSDASKSGRRFNEASLQFTGHRFQQEPGADWIEGIHPDDVEACLATYAEHFEARTPFTMEYRLRRPPGDYRWIMDSGVPLLSKADGAFSGYIGTCVDITEHKRAEAALREGQARYRLLFNSMDQGFCIIEMLFDESGRPVDYIFREINAAFVEQTGLANVVGRSMRELAPAHEQSWFETYGRIARTGEPERFEHGATALGHFYEVYAFRVGEPQQNRVGILFRDITKRKENERQLREADRRKDEFLATLAHELRNPLAPLKNGVQIARLTSPSNAPLQRTIEMMDRQLNHLVRLVDDLLDVARISSGKVVLKSEAVTLREVLAHSVEATRLLIDGRAQHLVVEPVPEELCVHGDPDRLAQIFSNLLSNAAKYTDAGGEIRIRVEREGEYAIVRIIDTGIGIAQEDLSRVFDLFSQVGEHHGKADGGLGIGLSLVRGLVQTHGGSVNAESAGPGRGSTFTVRLPLCQRDAPADTDSPVRTHTGSPRRRILVVDDNVDAANSLAALLEMEGHEVHAAYDGAQALELCRQLQPEIVFLDLGMPTMDGFEVARHLRASPATGQALLVALTGWGQPADRLRTAEADFDAHLVKPVELDEISALLNQPARKLPP